MKPIKFNLSYGNEQIKSLAELKENCNIDMLLETHSNGLLVRWLTAQGETEKAQKVLEIKTDDKQKALEQLFETLFGSFPTIAQQTATELFEMRNKEIKRLENYELLGKQEKEIIADYHKGYKTLIENLKQHSENYIALKADMITLYDQYRASLWLDKERFYQIFKEDYPLVLLALMANIPLREYIGYSGETVYNDVWKWLKNMRENIRSNENLVTKMLNSFGIETTKKSPAILIESEEQLNEIKKTCTNTSFGNIYKKNGKWTWLTNGTLQVGEYYVPANDWTIPCTKIFCGQTESYWKDVEPKRKRLMIISMVAGNYLRNSGKEGEELSANDINHKFIITDGIDYKSNSQTDELIYMEV